MKFAALETLDNMTSAKDILGINKAKCVSARERRKPKWIEFVMIPAYGMCRIILKPPHPEEIQSPCQIIEHPSPSIDDIDMKDANNACIPVRVRIVVVVVTRQHHDITM
jgi:hypothetical protein